MSGQQQTDTRAQHARVPAIIASSGIVMRRSFIETSGDEGASEVPASYAIDADGDQAFFGDGACGGGDFDQVIARAEWRKIYIGRDDGAGRVGALARGDGEWQAHLPVRDNRRADVASTFVRRGQLDVRAFRSREQHVGGRPQRRPRRRCGAIDDRRTDQLAIARHVNRGRILQRAVLARESSPPRAMDPPRRLRSARSPSHCARWARGAPVADPAV
jgi:hypothetical protein